MTNHVKGSFYRNPFRSFWMGGYECTDKLNYFRKRVDFLQVTGHLQKLDEDYSRLSLFNIKTVREGIRWSKVEPSPYHYEWGDLRHMMETGARHGIQQVWDLCHFGFPDDLSPLDKSFANRFASLCREFVKVFRSVNADGPLVVTPINEVSFLSWLGGEVGATSPFCKEQGWEVKYALMKAYISSIEAMKEIEPDVRILTTEPLINIVPPLDATAEEIKQAAEHNEAQFQVTDILRGSLCPELGGKPEYLDIVGCNYYYNNQWQSTNGQTLDWLNHDGDARWLPLHQLMSQLYQRYQRPLVLSETSHPGIDRPVWIDYVAEQCIRVIEQQIPLWGVCWYPIIDRPDWDHLDPWHRSGLWDIDNTSQGLERFLHQQSATAFYAAQKRVNTCIAKHQSIPAQLQEQ